MRRLLLLLGLTLALIPACSGGDENPSQAAGADTQAETESPADQDRGVLDRIPDIVDELRPSVVAVMVEGDQGMGEGSGVIWNPDGAIVTNNHVVAGASRIQVTLATGQSLEAEVRAADPLTDLAVLTVERTELPAAEFAEDLPRVGELAVAMGNPFGFENSVTAGIVSGLHRSIPSGGQTPALVDLVQTDAPISPGNSGGALVDGDGQVIGINVAFIPPQARAVSLGFAIPSPTVADVVTQLLETGEVRHAFLGIRPAPITPQLAERFGLASDEGALVLSVVPGSAAEDSGLRPGDVIVAVGDAPVQTVEDLFAALRDRSPGDEVTLTVVRDSERRQVSVTLAERPEQ